jgi:hypothetical protein
VRGPLLPARCCGELLFIVAFGVRAEFVAAEGGRLCESSRCREVMPDVFGELPEWPLMAAGAFAVPAR